jgi:Na+(H+)/acetate symporter ActP
VLAFQLVNPPDTGTDWTQIIYAVVITAGVCFTAVMSYLGVKAGREGVKAGLAAKDEAARTQEYNSADHGRVVEALTELRDEVRHLGGRVHDVGQNIGTLRDQFVNHLQHHLDRDTTPGGPS